MATKTRDVTLFGDSFALGHGDASGNGGWGGMLARDFYADNAPLGNEAYATFYNLSVLGSTAVGLRERIKTEWNFRQRMSHPRLGIVAIGINDAAVIDTEGRPIEPVTPLPIFQESLAEVIDAITACGDQALYVGIPTFDESMGKRFRGRKKTFLLECIEAYEAAAIQVAAAIGVPSVPLFRPSLAVGYGDTMLADDRLHPSTLGHQWIYSLTLPVARDLWKGNGSNRP